MATRLVIRGLVQGVFYRASFAEEARRLGLRGWVRNLRDGSVEALIDGAEPALSQMISWARKGPPAARVTGVEVSESAESQQEGFDILPSA